MRGAGALGSIRRKPPRENIIASAQRILRNPYATKEEKTLAASILVRLRRRREEWVNP